MLTPFSRSPLLSLPLFLSPSPYSDEKSRFQAEMTGFRQLFDKYKEAKKNAPLDWDKIRVSSLNIRSI